MSQSAPQGVPSDRKVLARLEQPEDLTEVLKREGKDYDCLSCRVMGIPVSPLNP